MRKAKKIDSFVFYKGPSVINGEEIVGIAIGLDASSSNKKTGAMVQTYIIRTDKKPSEAVKDSSDNAICGDCPHRKSTCYVDKGKGPAMVYKKFARGGYTQLTPEEAREVLSNKAVRVGTYGDPYAIPAPVWSTMLQKVTDKTGYTHRWKDIGADALRSFCMASCDTAEEAQEALKLGWRYFLVVPKGTENPNIGKAFLCPASEEAGKKLLCEECLACDGTASGRNASVYIPVHGLSWKQASFGKLLTIGKL